MDRQCKVRAVRLAVMSFEQLLRGQLKLLADNTTAFAYICNQGGIHSVPPSWNGCSCGVPSATSLSIPFMTDHLNSLADLLSLDSQVLRTE